MTIELELDRRHAFYFDTDGNIRPFSPHLLDRLWRGEPDAALPELAGQRIRFAVLHIERFTSPPRVVVEYYPVLTLDTHGNVDLELQQQQLHAEVDRLEATTYAPTNNHESETTWHPDPATRRRLIAATRPSYRARTTDIHLPRAEERRPESNLWPRSGSSPVASTKTVRARNLASSRSPIRLIGAAVAPTTALVSSSSTTARLGGTDARRAATV